MSLRPASNIQKILISTTSSLKGEYEIPKLLFCHAWPDFHSGRTWERWSESPISRGAFIVAFETEPEGDLEESSLRVKPNYGHVGDIICSCLAVLFGKRFDYHGLVEENGRCHVPDMTQYAQLCNHRLPYNSHKPRVDFGVPLNLVEIARITKLVSGGDLDVHFSDAFERASRFYLRSLQAAEADPEVAYLHLITAGEVLAEAQNFDKDELLDDDTKAVLCKIEKTSAEGPELAKFVKNKLFQVRRKFILSISSFIDEGFFGRTDFAPTYARFTKDNFRKAMLAAYDLRSRHLHTGVPFQVWVNMGMGEVQIGKPVVEDSGLAAILERAPTYLGLERVIRYCLLRFAEKHGGYVAPKG